MAEWRLAQELAQKEREAAQRACMRFAEVKEEIAKLGRSGRLSVVLRPLAGGEYSAPRPRSDWHTEDYDLRFMIHMMHPARPFDAGAPGEEMQWIFVTRKSLDAVLARQLSKQRPRVVTDYQSEYMALMVNVIRALKITVDDQPKKIEVEEKIKELWEGPGSLSTVAVRYLATFIRMHASQRGRNKPDPGD